MNNTFDSKRFGLLLRRQWLEFGKVYLISLLVVLGIFLVFYGFNYNQIMDRAHVNNYSVNFRIPLFFAMGLLFITAIASTYYSHLGQKAKAISDLMMPASTFEKFLGGVFYTTVLGIGGYLLLFFLTDLVFIHQLRSWYEGLVTYRRELPVDKALPYFFTQSHEYTPSSFYLFPLLIVSLFLLGSVFFERFHYIKTAISIMAISGLWALIVVKSGEMLFRGRIRIEAPNELPSGNSSKDLAEWGLWFVFIVAILFFWIVTYFRLKEKEV